MIWGKVQKAKLKEISGAWKMAQSVECLLYRHDDRPEVGTTAPMEKPEAMVNVHSPQTVDGAGMLGITGQSAHLIGRALGSVRDCLKK